MQRAASASASALPGQSVIVSGRPGGYALAACNSRVTASEWTAVAVTSSPISAGIAMSAATARHRCARLLQIELALDALAIVVDLLALAEHQLHLGAPVLPV